MLLIIDRTIRLIKYKFHLSSRSVLFKICYFQNPNNQILVTFCEYIIIILFFRLILKIIRRFVIYCRKPLYF